MAIKIITDSACDITKEMEQKCGVEIIPLQVDLDGNLLKDREDITPLVVYEKMRSGAAPKTSLSTLTHRPATIKLSIFDFTKSRNMPSPAPLDKTILKVHWFLKYDTKACRR